MELTSEALIRRAFYRLVGTQHDDQELTVDGEADEEVADIALTRGVRSAQRYMLDAGHRGWRKRSAALTWTGSDATTGGVYSTLPSDFLKAYGSKRRSALVEADGTRWGTEVTDGDEDATGDGYYFGDYLWLTRQASPPTTLYLDYHYLHPAWSTAVTIDFPMEARPLIVAEAAAIGKDENWLPGGPDLERRIAQAQKVAQGAARAVARRSKQPREFQKARRLGNRW